MKVELPQFKGETREKIVARWRSILADPHAHDTAKRMAHQALFNLGARNEETPASDRA